MKICNKVIAVFFTSFLCLSIFTVNSFAASNSRTNNNLRSDVWRYSSGWGPDGSSISGNSLLWRYQVSATYTGSKSVEWIKTSWTGSVSLRNAASFTMGVSADGANIGWSSGWQYKGVSAYWTNYNGSKSAWYAQTMVAAPRMDYRSGSVNLNNTATVKLRSDSTRYFVTSAI